MSDLDKLMKKLKKDDPKQTTAEVEEEKVEDLEDDEDEDDEEEEADPVDPIPANVGEPNLVEQEVGLLQNDGIFRRELIHTLKEFVDVHKINTQALLDLVKIAGGNDGKKK